MTEITLTRGRLLGDGGGSICPTGQVAPIHGNEIQMATKTFQMPATDSAEFVELMARWAEKTITFGQCGMLKTKIKLADGQLGKLDSHTRKLVERISVRDEAGRWTVLRNDNPTLGMTMADAHCLASKLDSIVAGAPVTVTKQAPVASAAPVQKFSDGDETKISAYSAMMEIDRHSAISELIERGRISPASKSETIVDPPVGIYETTEGFRFEVYLVNVKGGGQAKRSRIL